MYSIRKWMFKPKKSDKSLLARLYYADEALNAVAAELDSFDGRKEPERCTLLINKLRHCQDKVLGIVEKIMDDAISDRRASRDFRVKFPDDVLQDNLAGQLWFGAECLSAGSSIMNREVESASMRPLARSLTKHLDQLRTLLREHCIRNQAPYPEELKRSLEVFDKLFSEFELSYVSAMVPVKTMRDYDVLQEVMVLFSETIQRALERRLITQEMLDDYDPALMFTIPRLAIVCGLITYPEGPLNPDMDPVNMCEMFRPFQTLLYKIRELLATLTEEELHLLEKCLCSNDEPAHLTNSMEIKEKEKKQSGDSPSQTKGSNKSTKSVTSNVSGTLRSRLNPSSSTTSSVSKRKRQSVEDIEENMYLSSESGSYQVPSVDEESSSDSEMTYDSDSSLHEGSSSQSVSSHISEQGDIDVHEENREDEDQKTTNNNKSSAGITKCMPHQDSRDSGMPSEPDHMTFETHTVESHRLRHSRSWPDTLGTGNNNGKRNSHSKSPSMNECLGNRGELGPSGGGPSLELIDSSHSDSDEEGRLLNRSAQEFTFNIPRNTSLDHPTEDEDAEQDDCENALVPSTNAQGYGQTSSSNSTSTRQFSGPSTSSNNTTPSHLPGHVAYVTDALNSTFMTDPEDALEVTFVDTEESSNETDKTPVCTKCQKRQTFPDESSICDIPCDTESTLSAKLPDQTGELCECEKVQQMETCVHNVTTHSHQTLAEYVCTSCQHRMGSGSTGDISTNTTSTNPGSAAVQEYLTSCRNRTEAKVIKTQEDEGNAHKDCIAMKSSDDLIECPETSKLSAQNGSSSSKSEPGDRPTCGCSGETSGGGGGGSSRQRRSHLDAHRSSSKVHYRRMKSTESSRSQHADKDSISSGDSASQTSESPEESEITLAIQAAEVAARKDARARFKSSGELIHRLFVCISGVADQLQTNYAADLRHILKCVFECNSSDVEPPPPPPTVVEEKTALEDTFVNITAPESPNQSFSSQPEAEITEGTEDITDTREEVCAEAPVWVPDEDAANCTACKAVFTFVRRRHHCRNCGKIFCGRCSSNSVPLPQYGHDKPVRVCNRCFVFHVTPFTTVDE